MLRSAYGKDSYALGKFKVIVDIRKTIVSFLCVTSFLLQSFISSESQVVSLSFKDASLQQVFTEIRKQTGYSFAYFDADLTKSKPVNIKITNTRVQDALNLIFQEQPLTYTIIEKVVVVKQKSTEKKTNQEQNPTQTFLPIEIMGRVINEQGDPVAGITIQVKGTKIGTFTNGEGEFFFKKVAPNAILVLTGVNIDPIERSVNGQQNLDIQVKVRPGKLDEVQVIAYGKTSQRYNTGNVTTIKASDIEKQPVSNPLFALQGRVPGLLVTQNTGVANGVFKVRIQGENSIRNGNEPLIVVDGIPLPNDASSNYFTDNPLSAGGGLTESGNNPINFINPADIESIDVLKDADATAIYGSRAANGAILITTKKGRIGKVKINVELQQGWNKVGRKADLLNTRQYLDMRYEAIRNDGVTIGTGTAFYDLTRWDTTRYTDWQKVLLGKTGGYTQGNISMSGGTNTVQYLVGATFRSNTTVFPGDYTNKSRTIHFNLNTSSVNQRFKLSFTGSYNINKNELPGVDLTVAALRLVPVAPSLFNPDGSLNWAPTASGSSTWDNPLAPSSYQNYEHISSLLMSNVEISYRIVPSLQIKTNAGYSNTRIETFYAQNLEAIRPELQRNIPRASRFGNFNIQSWLMEPQLIFHQQVGKGTIDALTGFTIQKKENEYLHLSASGFSSNLLLKNFSSANSITSIYSNNVYKYTALFGRFTFNWDRKYIINVSARRDGSSRFGPKSQFSNFWSVGTAWLFSEEKTLSRLNSIISFGKLRLSYGTTGNDGIPDYAFLNTYISTVAGIPYQGTNGLFTANISNPYLQWERTRKLQGGIDLGFLKDRILLNITYARNRSNNQLLIYPLPSITGDPSLEQNLPALVQNTSWEFSTSVIAIKGKEFTWNSSLNLTIPRNKLVSFPGIENTSYAKGTNGVIIGEPIGATYYYHYMGIDPNTGNYAFDDGNGNPVINPANNARKVLLSLQPKYYGGFINTFTYKSVTLDFLFQYIRQQGDRSIYYYTSSAARPGFFSRGQGNQPVSILNRWQKAGDASITAKYTTSLSGTVLEQSDAYYTYDASFIRLKNVSLSWEIPKSLLKKAHLQQGVLYFRGQNLATITSYSGLDPETGSNALPPLQVWTTGIRLSL